MKKPIFNKEKVFVIKPDRHGRMEYLGKGIDKKIISSCYGCRPVTATYNLNTKEAGMNGNML